MQFPRKLKGGALYIAIIISILTAVILGVFIMIAYYNSRSVIHKTVVDQLNLDLESGLAIGNSGYFEGQNNKWQNLSFNSDSIKIKKQVWGCYTLLSVEARKAHAAVCKTGLFGTTVCSDTAIMITEKSRPVGLAGSIKFNGGCYFPKAGFKPAYIEGSSFIDKGSIHAHLRQAPLVLPSLDEQLTKALGKTHAQLDSSTDSIIPALPVFLKHSFRYQTALFETQNITLQNYTLKGNVKIVAADKMIVDSQNDIADIFLLARKVIFKKGFKGNVHVLASDSIIVEDDCEFSYPSSLCINSASASNNNSASIRGIFFGVNCKFDGGLCAFSQSETAKVIIKLNSGFEGLCSIYSSGYAHLQGKIYGNVFCQTLLLQTPSAVYENHILNCLIDPKKFGNNLAMPSYFKNGAGNKCAKWL